MFSVFNNPRHPARFGTVTLPQLNRALGQVVRELNAHGLWDEKMAEVEVWLTPFDFVCYGWQYYGTTGEICIPAVSGAKLSDLWYGSYKPLADVLRHEYGHALADTHRGLFRSSRFRDAFYASHEDESRFEHDPEFHVSEYAATNASEDFAECFMLFLRHTGRLPTAHQTSAKRQKWKFVGQVCQAVQAGRRSW